MSYINYWHIYIFRYSTIVTSGNKDISLLPFLGEKHTCILFFIIIFTLDSNIRRNTKRRSYTWYSSVIGFSSQPYGL